MKIRKIEPAWLLAVIIPIMFIIAIVAFLTSEECYQNYCITGWEVLKLEWPSFWVFAWGGLGVGFICLILAYLNETGKGAIGRKMRGRLGVTIALIIISLLVICGPWGKACTDKSNGGVTAPGFKAINKLP